MNGKCMLYAIALGVLACAALHAAEPSGPNIVLNNSKLRDYVARFNADDEELYANIPNEEAFDFLDRNIPLFECPDQDIERTYYFRWWTYRKHVKKTPDGWVITEFLPKVPWSAKHNTISCPAGHHFYEGRWLRDAKYLDDYAVFWFRKGGSPRRYSFWAADAIYADFLVRPEPKLVIDLLDDLVANYEAWEQLRLTADGLFWQIDDRDGMEVSIGKSGKTGHHQQLHVRRRRGDRAHRRPWRDARTWRPNTEAKAARLKELVQTKLWDDEAKFFKTLPRSHYELATPKNSRDGSVPDALVDKGSPGTLEWVQYTCRPRRVLTPSRSTGTTTGAAFVCRSRGGCRIATARAGRLLPTQPLTRSWPDRFNRVTFAAVETDALRLEVQSHEGKVGGPLRVACPCRGTRTWPRGQSSASFPTRPWAAATRSRALNDGEGESTEAELVDVREQHGFTPWYFNLPEPGKGYEVAWKQLMDPEGFYAPFGPTTAEQRHPGFKISYEGHGCQWNGPSWPFATAVTLTAHGQRPEQLPAGRHHQGTTSRR